MERTNAIHEISRTDTNRRQRLRSFSSLQRNGNAFPSECGTPPDRSAHVIFGSPRDRYTSAGSLYQFSIRMFQRMHCVIGAKAEVVRYVHSLLQKIRKMPRKIRRKTRNLILKSVSVLGGMVIARKARTKLRTGCVVECNTTHRLSREVYSVERRHECA
jgi:hypothetical protein